MCIRDRAQATQSPVPQSPAPQSRTPQPKTMKAAVYQENGIITLEDRPVPRLKDPQDAIIKVTLTTICSSDIHIKHGAVPRAVPGTCLLYTSIDHDVIRNLCCGNSVEQET